MAGELVHTELPAREPARARRFWSRLFGWTFRDAELPGGYWITRTGAHQGGAVLPAGAGGAGIVGSFECDDIGASAAKVRERGGRAEDPLPIPRVGWFARCADSEGNAFRLYQGDESGA